jgi:hypothetical protein
MNDSYVLPPTTRCNRTILDNACLILLSTVSQYQLLVRPGALFLHDGSHLTASEATMSPNTYEEVTASDRADEGRGRSAPSTRPCVPPRKPTCFAESALLRGPQCDMRKTGWLRIRRSGCSGMHALLFICGAVAPMQ